VLLQQSPEDLRALVERFLPLPEPLLRTLEEWLAGEGNQAAAAERLHVHVNTLRYRLGRVEASLGLSLKSPAALARIHLALRAKGLLEEEG
jgi:DNA-binding PucR family transcriptional regulator